MRFCTFGPQEDRTYKVLSFVKLIVIHEGKKGLEATPLAILAREMCPALIVYRVGGLPLLPISRRHFSPPIAPRCIPAASLSQGSP